jgi:dephospho-CoA kinase
MLKIGLTGPSGAGKSMVAGLFTRWNIPTIDTDAVYHELLTPPSRCLDELVATFGKEILTLDGCLDRPVLASFVFDPEHPDRLEQLNRIAHHYILEQVRILCQTYEAQGSVAVLIDAPVLFESGFDKECDRTLAVLADPSTRLSRIMIRDGISRDAAMKRMGAQPSDDFYIHRADAVVYNDGEMTPEHLAAHIRDRLLAWEVMI